MLTNKELFDQAKEAIMRLHDDKSVPKEVAVMNLDEIRDEIDILIEGLKY